MRSPSLVAKQTTLSTQRSPTSAILLPQSQDSPLACVRLDMEDLQCFERVERQFDAWGVVFKNAIALHPSNPAFPTRTGKTVLTGAPHSSWIGVQFHRPVSYVSGFVTSSRQLALSAYNAADQLVAKSEIPSANLLDSTSMYPPNLQLSVRGQAITRIVFHAFNGQFTLDELVFTNEAVSGRSLPL
ncbi:MAG: hypothetical protein EA367_20935 [Leptolyngbya sp. DLM2.Bin15]|nr:MAG: hypothetical protein EA367_20935 [Leptolyngbya sp. DLM2.Bin15]